MQGLKLNHISKGTIYLCSSEHQNLFIWLHPVGDKCQACRCLYYNPDATSLLADINVTFLVLTGD